MDSRSDAQVIADSRTEPAAFATIFDRHYDVVHRYLGRRVGVEVAQELAAETFTQAFDARRRYNRSRSDARPWLFGIATNLLRHHHRSEARRLKAYSRIDRPADRHDDLAGIEARIDAQDARPALARALGRLSRDERNVVLLFAWADLQYEEIALALRIPIGTVRSRLHRARSRLRELIGESGQYPGDDTFTEALKTDG